MDGNSAPSETESGEEDPVRGCLERAEWRCSKRRYLHAPADESAPLALIETWRKA